MVLDPCHSGQLHCCTQIGSSIKPATNSIKPCCRSGQRSLPCSSWKSHYPSLLLASPSSFKLEIGRAVSTKCEQPPPCALVLVSSLQESAPPTPPRASQGSPAPSGRGLLRLVQVDTWEELRGLGEEKEQSAIKLQNIFHTSDKNQ